MSDEFEWDLVDKIVIDNLPQGDRPAFVAIVTNAIGNANIRLTFVRQLLGLTNILSAKKDADKLMETISLASKAFLIDTQIQPPELDENTPLYLARVLKFANESRDKIAMQIKRDLFSQKLSEKRNQIPGDSQTIAVNTRTLIRLHLVSLKDQVEALEIDSKKKELLLSRLAEFEALLEDRNTKLGRILTVLAIVGTTVVAVTATLADSEPAIKTIGKISALIGSDATSDEEAKLLELDIKPLQLPAPDRM